MLTDTLPGNYFEILGGDPERYSSETDRRVANFCRELEIKREYDNFTTFDSKDDQMIIANHLRIFSFCEHHLLPFYGEAAIGYIPQGKILGLSKFQRIVDKFSSRPQVQEELTGSILDFLNALLNPLGLGIVIRSIHTCVFARGPQSTNAEFTTSAMTGTFREKDATRQEFLSMILGNGRVRL